MRNITSANRREGDGHHAPSADTSGTGIVSARRARSAGALAVRRLPAIIGEFSSASRRFASLRPRSAWLTVLTPIPLSPSGPLSANGLVFELDPLSPTSGAVQGCGQAPKDAA
jgi:hypothetical protein